VGEREQRPFAPSAFSLCLPFDSLRSLRASCPLAAGCCLL